MDSLMMSIADDDAGKDSARQDMPNFFMPVKHLEEFMRTLQVMH